MLQRRTLIWVVIISSLISITITLLNYFGLVRYISLHFWGLPSRIEKYSKLPKAKDDSQVVVGLNAPTNSKWKQFKPVLASILDQTIRVDKLVLFVAQDEVSQVPDEFKAVFVVVPVASSATKAGDNLNKYEREVDTLLISLNSSIIYGKDFLEQLIAFADQKETTVQDQRQWSHLCRPRHYTTTDTPPVTTFRYTENYLGLRR
jgi:hypothetical protein